MHSILSTARQLQCISSVRPILPIAKKEKHGSISSIRRICASGTRQFHSILSTAWQLHCFFSSVWQLHSILSPNSVGDTSYSLVGKSFKAPSFFNQDCTSLCEGDEKTRLDVTIIDRCWMLNASNWTMKTISIVRRQILFWQESEQCASESEYPTTARLEKRQHDWKNNSKNGNKRLTLFHKGV